jgi:hypothetical protein
MKSIVRKLCYQLGLLKLYHRLFNRENLTVVMFHRVLHRDDPRWETAEPPYTMSDKIFDNCLRFFKRHYSPVTLAQVKQAHKQGCGLPPRPILITFDDGWSDNLLPRCQFSNAIMCRPLFSLRQA